MTRQSKEQLKRELDYYKNLAEYYENAWKEQYDNEAVPEYDYDPITEPEHYLSHPSGVEPIEITRHETFLRGNIIKYVMRAPFKGNELEDLEKAKQYLQWEIERVENQARL